MKIALRLFRWLLILLAVAAIAATFVPSIETNTWWIRTLDFVRIELLAGIVVVAILLLLVSRRWWSYALALLLVASGAYDAWILWAFTSWAPVQEVAAATSCPADRRLRILEANVQMTNRHDDRLVDMVRAAKPDIAWFQETDDWWAQELSSLSDILPNHVGHAQPNYYGVELYSRLDLVNPKVNFLTGSANASIFTGARLPSGQVFTLYAIHPRPPQKGQSTAERDAQLMATALAAHDDTGPHVLAGDLNSVPWESIIHQTRRVGRFLSPRRGRGLFISWNANDWWLKWPLDQILPGPDFTLLSLRVLPPFGSDHRPMLAEFCFDPDAATRQPPPALQPGDLDQARLAVRKGQGRADKTGEKGRD